MWFRLKTFCLHSLTVAWGYILALVGVVMQGVDVIADALGDPTLKEQIAASIGDTRVTGRILLGISVITIAARLRTIGKGD
jgi:hypothetical protein